MARVQYRDREGRAINQAQWKKLQADPAYTTVKEYDNGVVRVTLRWNGRVDGHAAATFPDYWPIYVLLVKNYRSDGTLVNDPVDNDKTYPNEEEALKGYQEFLLKWTQSDVDDSGEFVEEGNVLAAPEPPDPSKPSTVPEDEALGGVGAW